MDLTRRTFLAAGQLFVGALFASRAIGRESELDRLYARAFVIDTLTNDGPGFDAGAALDAGMTAAVVDLPIFPRNMPSAMRALEAWREAFARPDARYLKVLTAADLARAKQERKFGVILSCQDAAILDSSTGSVNDYNLQILKKYSELGLRILQLTHNERNAIGDSFREKTNAGLSRLGERVVAAMNELGMMIDLSHCGDTTTIEAIRLSKKPCAITHSGCRALYPTLRNKPDEHIRALAERGGVFGIFNMSLWLTERPTTSVDDVVAHIDHAVKLAGVEGVSFGSDGPVLENRTPEDQMLKGMRGYAERNLGLPGAERLPSHVLVRELNSPRRLYVLAGALERKGYKTEAIEKIIGGNFVRLFREVCG